VTVAELQTYLHDSSTDPDLLDFYQALLDTATENVYDWLDRDYTASATKSETFIGGGTLWHFTKYPVATLLSWTTSDIDGVLETRDVADLIIRLGGRALQCVNDVFSSDLEHTITYKQPASITCPETVRQAILEIAAIMFDESRQGSGALGLETLSTYEDLNHERARFLSLVDRHAAMLSPYRRAAL
jgi:hypothetical protein